MASDVALTIGRDTIHSLGLRFSLNTVGSSLLSTQCSLENGGGVIAVGLGKGLAGQDITSAVFEALEHYLYESEDLLEHAIVRNLALDSEDGILATCSPDFALICGDTSFPLTLCKFHPITEGYSAIQMPAFLFYPDFESVLDAENRALRSFRLLRYSTNSGTASGLNRDEATLHGVLEVIERDSVGVELLRTVIRNPPWPVRRILLSTLPEELKEICVLTARETGLQPVLFDITTDLNVPSILCMLQPASSERRAYFGSGASLLPAYAAERALLESVQNFHCHKHFSIPLPPMPIGANARMSRYHRCFLTAGIFAYRAGEVDIAFEDLQPLIANVETLSPAEQLSYVAKMLASNGYPCFDRTVFDGGVQVRQVVVPGLEHFNLVSYGIPVAPGARGRAVLAGTPVSA